MKKRTSKKVSIQPQRTDFSDFFIQKNDEEKKRLLEEVVRKANEDQRAIVEEYDRRFAKTV